MADAKFQDGGEGALLLIAQNAEDVAVISALVQDAVLSINDLRYDRPRRRFALLINRFRWEDKAEAERQNRAYERVRSVLTIEDATAVRSMGIDRNDKEAVLSILSIQWEEKAEGAGRLTLILAGDGAIALEVEALELRLEDVTKPYYANARKAPVHPE